MTRILCFLMVLMFMQPAWAKTEFFAVIPVEQEAQDSVQAKENAMQYAQRKAFMEVAAKLIDEENVQKLSTLSDDEILHFIQSVSVADEKAGGNIYKANLTVEINEQLLKDYLAENEMIQAETVDLLAIPILKNSYDNYPLLWEENNVWRKNWLSKGLIKFGTLQIHTISEKFRNIDDLNANSALYMGSDLYNQISAANNSDRVYVIYAQIVENGDMRITIKNEKMKSEETFTIYNDADADIYDKAIEKCVMTISNMERESKNNEQINVADSLNAVYMYQDMKDWLAKSKTISDLPMVEGIDTKSFGGGRVNFSVRYTGNIDGLWEALQEVGLSHEAQGNYYIIR